MIQSPKEISTNFFKLMPADLFLTDRRISMNNVAYSPCVIYDAWNTTDSFQEIGAFSRSMPYCILVKRFPVDDVTPIHYSHTIEILVCDNLRGTIFIKDRDYPLQGKQVFIISPYTIHSNNITACNGVLYCFQVSFSDLEYYINIPHYLQSFGCDLEKISCQCPDYDTFLKYIQLLMEHDGDPGICLPTLLQIFQFLARYTDETQASPYRNTRFGALGLQKLINWTQQKCTRKITLEEAAQTTGYSKSHFCVLFKEITGNSYINYLNTVRISHACLLLRNGRSIQDACYASGFENMSYFIQTFKKVQNMTPRQYVLQLENAAN